MQEELTIQSFSDVITNSSSELFVIKTDQTKEEIESLMKSWQIKDDDWSGMGGCLEVYDRKTPYPDTDYIDEGYKDKPAYPWLDEHHMAIHIDWGMKKHIDKIFEDLEVVDSDSVPLIFDNRGEKTKVRKYSQDIKSLEEGEEIKAEGTNYINAAKISYANRVLEETQNEMNKIADMKTMKKYYQLYREYLEAQYTIEDAGLEDEESVEWCKRRNQELHEKKH